MLTNVFLSHLDANMSTYKTRLSEAVAIPSVSSSQETEHVEATRSVLEDFTRPVSAAWNFKL